MEKTRDELAATVDVVEWTWLRTHLERGGVIVVAQDLDLADVGSKVASDDAQSIGALIASGKIGKPSLEQITAWDGDKQKTFEMLVVSPYVLVREQSH